jgi:hypothetical protein
VKVANKKPEISKSRTYVTQDCYEVWYSKPVSLGQINKRNGYWYSADGHRFLSSRDATDYLVKLRDMQFPIRDEVLVVTQLKPSLVVPPRNPMRKTLGNIPKKHTEMPKEIPLEATRHPLFQDYLKFLDYLQTGKNQ